MAQIKISVKGKLEMTLTRNYNSLSVFTANKDDVGFNETGNDFYNYCITSPCGSWVGDKIKILSLPNKGRLYYNSTPLSTPTYANVTVGQEIMVRDLIDYKVLRFSAEGSADGQFTESYLTNFTFERYCVSTAQNITVKVNLNMIDDKLAVSNIYVTDVVRDNGTVFFTLHVENEPFVGYLHHKGGGRNFNTEFAVISSTHGVNLYIPNETPFLVDVYNLASVNIPVGVYPSCSLSASASFKDPMLDITVNGELAYGLTTVYADSIVFLNVSFYSSGIIY